MTERYILASKVEAMARELEQRRPKDGSPYECGVQNRAQVDARWLHALLASAVGLPEFGVGGYVCKRCGLVNPLAFDEKGVPFGKSGGLQHWSSKREFCGPVEVVAPPVPDDKLREAAVAVVREQLTILLAPIFVTECGMSPVRAVEVQRDIVAKVSAVLAARPAKDGKRCPRCKARYHPPMVFDAETDENKATCHDCGWPSPDSRPAEDGLKERTPMQGGTKYTQSQWCPDCKRERRFTDTLCYGCGAALIRGKPEVEK